MDYGNIAGVVKSFTEPQDSAGSPKRFVVWAKEVTEGSSAVELLIYDFILSKWKPLAQPGSVFKVNVLGTSNLSAFSPVSVVGGTTLVNGDRVLLTGQTDKKQNGIYTYNSSTNTLSRSSFFSIQVPGDHIVYITNGAGLGKIYYSLNSSQASFLTVDTDNIEYRTTTSTVESSINPMRMVLLSTSDSDATTANYITRFVTKFNALPGFSISTKDLVIVKHSYQTPTIVGGGTKVSRVTYFRFNQRNGVSSYGAGNEAVSAADFIEVTPNYLTEAVLHPDQLSLNGMGAFDFGNSELNIAESSNSTQQVFNTKTALGINKMLKGQRICVYGQLDVKKIEANTDDTMIESGDRVINSNLNGDIFLIYGEYVSGDPLEKDNYANAEFYDPNE